MSDEIVATTHLVGSSTFGGGCGLAASAGLCLLIRVLGLLRLSSSAGGVVVGRRGGPGGGAAVGSLSRLRFGHDRCWLVLLLGVEG